MVLFVIAAAVEGGAPSGCLCYTSDGYGLSPCTSYGCAHGGAGNYGLTSAGYGGNNAGTYCYGNKANAANVNRGFKAGSANCLGTSGAEACCCNFCCAPTSCSASSRRTLLQELRELMESSEEK